MMDEDDDELSLAGQIAFWLMKNRMLVVISVGLIFLCVTVSAMLLSPSELYAVQGEIVRIEETGYVVNVATVQPSVPVGERIISPLFITSGLCHLDPDFGREHCKVGAKVELARLENTFRTWWYLSALIKDYDEDYDYVIEEEACVDL